MDKILTGSRKLKISEIKIGNRIREDMGNLQELAESLRKYSLIHPIVVDDEWNLVTGCRRIEAAKLLGWDEIEVRFAAELTDKEKRAIELEENIRRKDLTSDEQSKKTFELIETVKEIVRTPGSRTPEKSFGVVIPGSYPDISNRTGIPKSTLKEAVYHVEAVEKHPELKGLPKKQAIRKAKELDKQTEPKVEMTEPTPEEKRKTQEIMFFYDIVHSLKNATERTEILNNQIEDGIKKGYVPPEPYIEVLKSYASTITQLSVSLQKIVKEAIECTTKELS